MRSFDVCLVCHYAGCDDGGFLPADYAPVFEQSLLVMSSEASVCCVRFPVVCSNFCFGFPPFRCLSGELVIQGCKAVPVIGQC